MKQNHLFTYSKICALALVGAGALFFTSCAKDGYDDESFDSGVSNTQVASISADDITVTPSADGKTQTISWPVVMGAGGYRVNLIDASSPDEPLINDSIVDGCSVTTKREEDVNYEMTILTLGNKIDLFFHICLKIQMKYIVRREYELSLMLFAIYKSNDSI